MYFGACDNGALLGGVDGSGSGGAYRGGGPSYQSLSMAFRSGGGSDEDGPVTSDTRLHRLGIGFWGSVFGVFPLRLVWGV